MEIVKWSTLFTHVPYHFPPWIHFAPVSFCPPPPYEFAPWKLLNDLHYLPMPHIIFPLDLPPYHFATISFCPLERNGFMIYTIYPCSISFCPLDWTLNWVGLLCFNRMIGQMLTCSDFTIVIFIFVLIKSPLQQKLMTGAHPVTVAPLVSYMLWHIELKFYIWLCLTVLQIKFECRQFASIFVGVMPLSGLRILAIHSYIHALTNLAEI